MFSRRKACRGKNQNPVVWIAGWRETKTLKPIDNVSRGEATSHRAVTTVSAPGDRQGVGGERSHGRLDSDRRARQSEVAKPPTLETTMQVAADRTDASTAIQTDLPAIFASLELSRSTWLITSLSPG